MNPVPTKDAREELPLAHMTGRFMRLAVLPVACNVFRRNRASTSVPSATPHVSSTLGRHNTQFLRKCARAEATHQVDNAPAP